MRRDLIDGEKTVFAIIVNPRDGVPFVAIKTDHSGVLEYSDVSINRVDTGDVEGVGEFEDDAGSVHNFSSVISGYPRVHTHDGVKTKFSGTGTVLYTALCTAAAMESDRRLAIYVTTSGAGISSGVGRSELAYHWWDLAKSRYGLATEVSGKVTKTLKNQKLVVSPFIASEMEGLLIDALAASLSVSRSSLSVKGASFQASGSMTYTGKADVYTYQRATDKHLVAITTNQIVSEASEFDEGLVDSVDVEALAAMNMTVFSKSSLFWSIVSIAKKAGVASSYINDMIERQRAGVDAEAAARGVERRSNPQPDARRVADRLRALRSDLGWDAFDDEAS